MTKLIRELGPLALIVAVLALVIAYLLSTGNSLGAWLLAAFLVGHGWVHLMYVMPEPKAQAATAGGSDWPFSLERSWFGAGGAAHAVGVTLVGIAVVGYMLAGLATVSILVPADLWLPLVVGSTSASAALLLLYFNPALVIGLAIDVVLLLAVMLTSWRPM